MLTNNQIVLEQELLGSIFKNNNLMLKAREKIKPEMFLYSKHMNIYLGILDMVANKLEVDLITFLEHHKKRIGDMDGVTYVTEIYTCSASDIGFNTKLDMLVNNYKRHLYVEMKDKINAVMEENGTPITLGKRILRTETAGMAIMSVIMFMMEE